MKPDKKYLAITGFALVGLLALHFLGVETRKHFFINRSGSEPIGLYKTEPFNGNLKRGQLVILTLPTEYEKYVYGRKWLPHGWPLLKNVGALPGDSYTILEPLFRVQGKLTGCVFPRDSKGLPLPHLSGNFKVRPGFFLPVATHMPKSFDGRYMGDVSQAYIVATAKPLLTF